MYRGGWVGTEQKGIRKKGKKRNTKEIKQANNNVKNSNATPQCNY